LGVTTDWERETKTKGKGKPKVDQLERETEWIKRTSVRQFVCRSLSFVFCYAYLHLASAQINMPNSTFDVIKWPCHGGVGNSNAELAND
jgi:hypothetical protein